MTNAIKQEASLPVQSRVDIRTLANLVEYWASKGEKMQSMSQLLSWSVELAQHMLSINNLLPIVIDSVSEANTYLIDAGLYQPGIRKRGAKKVLNAMIFESSRQKGTDPKDSLRPQYNTIHKENSVKTPEFQGPMTRGTGRADVDEAMRIYNELERKDKEKMHRDADKAVEDYKKNTEIDPVTGAYVTPKNPVKDKVPEGEVVQPTMPAVEVKGSDRLKPMDKKKLHQTALDIEKGDREYAEKLKNM